MSHWLLWSIIRLPLAAHQWPWSCWRLCQGTVRRARWTLASTGVSTRRWCGSHPGWGLWRTVATFPCPRRTSPTWKWVLLEDCGNPIKTNQDFPDVFPLPLNHDGGGEDQSSSMFLTIFLLQTTSFQCSKMFQGLLCRWSLHPETEDSLLTNPDVSRISVGDLFVQRTAVAKDDKEDRQAGREERRIALLQLEYVYPTCCLFICTVCPSGILLFTSTECFTE